MDEVEFHAPPRESKSKRWLSFHPFSGDVHKNIIIQLLQNVFAYSTRALPCILQVLGNLDKTCPCLASSFHHWQML